MLPFWAVHPDRRTRRAFPRRALTGPGYDLNSVIIKGELNGDRRPSRAESTGAERSAGDRRIAAARADRRRRNGVGLPLPDQGQPAGRAEGHPARVRPGAGLPCPLRARCTAQALQSVHAASVIHRDLKPSNILLSSNGPWVIDFGIARATDATQLTRSGGFIGTPQ
ncbi:phosphotransferase [Streptomyces sp. NBC_00347]|nr:phosphotransferase [Streptomyces sp. NBC_00347]MCX5123776.1 phosphotransferase [Streptomyces sp. NBC_00347]